MTERVLRPAVLCCVLMLAGSMATAQQKKDAAPMTDKYEEQLARYLDSARQQAAGGTAAAGSEWVNNLMGDPRARHLNDLITIRVVESITAKGSADSTLSKEGKGSAGVTGMFGAESKLPSFIDSANLLAGKSSTDFKGAGTTTRGGELTAIVTGRVAEVLPNGDLFIESVREIAINGDRQVVVMTGVARVADISPGNVVMSTSLGELKIRYFGNGLMKDSLSPGWFIRVMNKIF
jgi:flagellar L-ring protein FlgH